MEKTYSPHDIEQALYQRWEQSDYFKPSGTGTPYCIIIPPPNITGSLHMGHGFQQTIMDALTRYHRMCGDNTLWQPGTDHAGIATQMVVERQLGQEQKTRHDIGREAFTDKIWAWKQQSGGTINQQSRRLGISPDWSRERFTMDDDLCQAVQKTFISLYNEGLIYRGKRLVSWDPALHTAISNLEVINKTEQGHLWHIRYPLLEGTGYIQIATTRPETMLGDTAIAVHPNDTRYQALIGQQVKLPLTDRVIPIIADHYVDPEFGTGCVKITPAHDFNDYEVGKRHDLPLINILTIDAKLNENTPEKYQGLDRFVARKAIIEDLKACDALVKIDDHELSIPYGDRSHVVIEPYLTDQWFVSTKPLAKPAIDAVKSGEIRFVPEHWDKTYFQWMDNIEDWCISRQLWWGHRIPAWYDELGNVYVGETKEAIYAQHNLDPTVKLTQDEDVLDTWFSAALWPFSTLGWPEKTDALKTFYPTSTLVTAFDIIFFWVARMIMFGLKFMGTAPFKEIYITGLIRDEDGQKMSKSKGNVLDPIDLIDGIDLTALIKKRTADMMQPQLAKKTETATKKQFPKGIAAHGTDALRFTFCALANNNRDIRFDMGRLDGYRNFCNKLWNAARFVLMNTENQNNEPGGEQSLADQWITSRLQQIIEKTHHYFATYRFDYLAQALHEFVWGEFCAWYLELCKATLNNKNATRAQQQGTRHTLLCVLETLLRLLHPIMPFITETIWQTIAPLLNIQGASIMLTAFPTPDKARENPTAEQDICWLQDVTLAVRQVRAEMNISPGKALSVYCWQPSGKKEHTPEQLHCLQSIARIDTLHWPTETPALENAVTALVGDLELHIPLAGLIDIDAEIQRLTKAIDKHEKTNEQFSKKLSNSNFLDKAPEAVILTLREKLAQNQTSLEKLKIQLRTYTE
jgi:valyl-tRNA synthetase